MAEEIDPAVIKKTQDILGSVIRKPVLSEKSLKKPPFRFLHDIITNVRHNFIYAISFYLLKLKFIFKIY